LAVCSNTIAILDNTLIESFSTAALFKMTMMLEQAAKPTSNAWHFWILACRLVVPL
jgi:hypothetical protein